MRLEDCKPGMRVAVLNNDGEKERILTIDRVNRQGIVIMSDESMCLAIHLRKLKPRKKPMRVELETTVTGRNDGIKGTIDGIEGTIHWFKELAPFIGKKVKVKITEVL